MSSAVSIQPGRLSIAPPHQMQVARAANLLARVQYTPQVPTPKQAAFLALDCEEAMFGGAAGPGKSSALLMAALQFVDVPGYNALILRRTFADLSKPGAIMDRAHEWLAGTDARWNGQTKTYTFPSGARLTFGYLQNAGDHLQYQGAEFSFVGFDELTQFPRFQYKYLFSRLRRLAGSDVPLRMRSASNPGGPGHEWVKRRFIDRVRAGRCFLPSRLTENPHLDQASYRRTLRHLDRVERERLEHGNWDVVKEGLVYPDFARCQVEPNEVPPDLYRPEYGTPYGGIDWGFNNPFAALRGILDPDDVLWIHWERYKRFRTVAQNAARLYRDPNPQRAQTLWFADPSRPENILELQQLDFLLRSAPNRIETGVDIVTERIATHRLKVVSTCRALFTEISLYSTGAVPDEDEDDDDEDRDHVETVDHGEGNDPVDTDATSASEIPDRQHDHLADALRYMCAGIAAERGYSPGGPANLVPETHDPGDPEPTEDDLRYHRRWDNPDFWPDR